MKRILLVSLAALFFVFQSCNHSCSHGDVSKNTNEHLEMAVLFQQTAAEYKALCYQAFNIAELMIEKDLLETKTEKPRAIIFDIDETLLDNSPYEAKCILDNISYPEGWEDWCNLAVAKPLPGAIDFINHAVAKGYHIFYITNRKENLHDVTVKNMLGVGFPLEDEKYLLMRTDENSKETRRLKIEETYHISMLVGDNLGDFCQVFDGVDIKERDTQTENLKHKFGTKFIVLPNAMYGDWEMALYNHNGKISAEEKSDLRKSFLKSF